MNGLHPTTVLHVITALSNGGAEAMLAKLVTADSGAEAPRHVVVSLMPLGTVGSQLVAQGVEVHTLNMPRGRWRLRGLLRLLRLMRRLRPEVIQGWMYHGNVAAWAARRLSFVPARLVWNVRHSVHDLCKETASTARMIRWNARLSRQADLIIFNARSAVTQHADLGFDVSAGRVVPNGFDLGLFIPDDEPRSYRAALIRELGIASDAIVVGMIARVHPMKDHANLFAAVREIRAAGHDIHLVLAGAGTEELGRSSDPGLREIPANRLSLLGDRRDLPSWLPGLDLAVLSSAWGEGFPNVIGEAMASGVPCVVTDVGDSREIVREGGLCVAPEDPGALARSLILLIEAGAQIRRAVGSEGRRRIEDQYGIERIVARYADIYRSEARQRAALPAGPREGVASCVG
ncbi:MAG: glycosyltransferase [Novosphingobium sp.]|nr:MAG: glycosyltransferase [Novosphingobium sp.]